MSNSKTSNNELQGEGNREADRQYREKTREFVKSGKVDKAAEKAGDINPEEAAAAEKVGKDKARELDPQVHREHDKPTERKP